METKNEIKKQLILFFVITIILTSGIFIWMFNGAKDNVGAVLVIMWTPGISAIVTSIILKNKIRNFGWKPGKIRFLGYAYLFPLVVSLFAYGIVWISGIAQFTTESVVNYKWAKMIGFDIPAPFFVGLFSKMSIGFLVTSIFVLGEEIGWSGFLTPKLSEIFSIPVTSVIVGVFWAIWHYPAIIGGFYGQGTPLWIALPGFTLVLVGYSFVRTVLLSKSRSLWSGVVLHSSGNIILMGAFWEMTVHQGNAAYIVSETGIFTGIICLIFSLAFLKILNLNCK